MLFFNFIYNQRIGGGITFTEWKSGVEYISDPKATLFTFSPSYKKYPVKSDKALKYSSKYGPIFGVGFDFFFINF